MSASAFNMRSPAYADGDRLLRTEPVILHHLHRQGAMRKRTSADILRIVSTTAAIIAAFVIAALSFFGRAIQLDTNIVLAVILAVLGSLLLYVFGRAERLTDDITSIREAVAMNSTSVEIFNSRDEWASRLMTESLRSVEVSTQMFSDVKLGRDMNDYFFRIHREIRTKKLPFRRMASTGSIEKVCWLFELLAEMHSADSFSLGIIDVDHTKVPLNAFQICRQSDGNYSVFVFSSNIFEPGTHTCLVTDRTFGEFAQRTYNKFWDSATTMKLKDGPRVYWDRIRDLAERYGATQTDEYRTLMRFAEPVRTSHR